MGSSEKKPVERLFPFVVKTRILVTGREKMRLMQKGLQFVLITTDLTENSQKEVFKNFTSVPVIKKYRSDELEKFFGVSNAKIVGFKRSSLALSILNELQESVE